MPKRRILWLLLALPILGVFFIGGSLTLAVQLENRDSFCASCHTEPESTFFTRSLEPPVDLASAHSQTEVSVRCIDCHSGEGINGRTGSLQQGVIDLLAYISGDFTQPATTHNPVGDIGCTKCHTPHISKDELSTGIEFQSHYHLASYLNEWDLRAPQAAGTCATCHSAHSLGTNADNHFTPPSNDTCEDCHRALSGWQAPDS
ncbi:MAG: hypothetical protein DWQ07_00095 [Chloroflexi bacterium]|nr:MAG: hypothetical protein DWQ07_00095 [Chloroflexota bacterium]MBL1196038.1 hypothetical protein [Chloroflexota bacterium]NOH13332.1 hypothetical protein [Chloroflexota bacterium]